MKQKYEEYPAKKINRVWLSHMLVMNEILKDYGGNNFRIPHMNKEKLERDNRLPWILTVDAAAIQPANTRNPMLFCRLDLLLSYMIIPSHGPLVRYRMTEYDGPARC